MVKTIIISLNRLISRFPLSSSLEKERAEYGGKGI